MRELTDLEKRLITCMYSGVFIYSENGHRYIEMSDIDYGLEEKLDEKQMRCRSKCYGGFLEALDRVDNCHQLVYGETLLERFDESINDADGWEIFDIHDNDDTDIMLKGKWLNKAELKKEIDLKRGGK